MSLQQAHATATLVKKAELRNLRRMGSRARTRALSTDLSYPSQAHVVSVTEHFCRVRHTPEHTNGNSYTKTVYTTGKSALEKLKLRAKGIFRKNFPNVKKLQKKIL